MADGDTQTAEVRYPKGHAKNPLTDAELEAKFRRIFTDGGRTAQCEPALQALWAFDRTPDAAARVFGLLR